MNKGYIILGVMLVLASCEPEVESVPQKDMPKVDTSAINKPAKTKPTIPQGENVYAAIEAKLKALPQVEHANTELKKQNKELLKTKIVDKKADSLFSIKFGKTLDTNFISEYEFYINKKTKAISVYDKGEDRMIPLEQWQKMNELY